MFFQALHVSIPYSSIKSVRFHLYFAQFLVSIPYSSIKRQPVLHISVHQVMFQFHIVRLKVGLLQTVLLPAWKFQFHIVRLKVQYYADMYAADDKFQFHIVRLKASDSRGRISAESCFNSI